MSQKVDIHFYFKGHQKLSNGEWWAFLREVRMDESSGTYLPDESPISLTRN